MTEKEIENAMQDLFLGAARVRAHKHTNKVFRNIHGKLTSPLAKQIWNEELRNFNVA